MSLSKAHFLPYLSTGNALEVMAPPDMPEKLLTEKLKPEYKQTN